MPQWTHRGWPMHYPIIQLLGMVGYLPSQWQTTLFSLGIPYIMYASVHFKCLFNMAQPMRALIDIGGGYHLGAPNIRSDYSSFFPSSILHFPLIAPPGLQFMSFYELFKFSTFQSRPGHKSPKSHGWSLLLDFYQNSIH
jgi:hypothetical protein